jgi:hypothetical protein
VVDRDDLRVNWFLVIVEMSRRGYSDTAIAGAIGTPRSTVRGWKQGAEPRHADGERMILLWCQVTGMERDTLPKISRYDWRA